MIGDMLTNIKNFSAMTNKRIYYSQFYSQFPDRKKLGYGYRVVFYLLITTLLASCNASNPPRDPPNQPSTPAGEARPDLAQNAARKETTPLTSTLVEKPVTEGEDYPIGPADLLNIEVFQVPELSQTVRVNSKGYISLPLIGSVQISGLTSQQLEVYLAELLSEKYLQNPQVSVFIEEYTSQRVTVAGAINKPGIYPLKGEMTLLQVIAAAQGVTDVADRGEIKVLRSAGDNTRQIFYYDIEAIREGNVPDPEIHNNDILVISESATKVFLKGFSQYFRVFFNPLIFF